MQETKQMKTLTELIKEHNTTDYITEQLRDHLYIHFAFNNIQKHSFYTFESLGLFKGCKELVAYIIDDLKLSQVDFSKYDSLDNCLEIDTPSDCFTKQIRLSFSKQSDKNAFTNAEYIYGFIDEKKDLEYEKKRWNGRTFNFINIKFTINEKDLYNNSLAELLTHELVHAWWDYIIRTKFKKKKTSYRIQYDKYDLRHEFDDLRNALLKVQKSAKDVESYRDASIKLQVIDAVNDVLYRLNKFEIESYVAQLNGALHGKKFDHIEDAIEEIKKTSTYQNYEYIYNIAVVHNCVGLKEYCDENLCKKLKYLANKVWKRIINHLYHICADHINEDAHTHKTNRYYITEAIKPIWRRI